MTGQLDAVVVGAGPNGPAAPSTGGHAVRRRPPVRTITLVSLTAVVMGVAVLGLVINLTAPHDRDQLRVGQFLYLCGPLCYSLIGGYLLIRVHGNMTGAALWVTGLATTATSPSQGLMNHWVAGDAVPAGLLSWAAWLNNWTWLLAFGGLLVLLLYFPEGRQPGRAWQYLELGWYLVLAAGLLVCVASPVSVDHAGLRTPVRLGPLSRISQRHLQLVVGLVLVYFALAMLGTIVHLVIRWRRAHGARRAQLQWLLASAAGLLLVLLVSELIAFLVHLGVLPALGNQLIDLASQVTVPAVAASVAVAVTRHGLFEIDRVVSRTVSYSVVIAFLVAAYVAVVASVSALVPGHAGPLPVIAATLAVSALFVPLRRRVIRVIDRRFNRSKYDTEAVVAEFAERLRGRAGQGTTGEDLVTAARQVLQPRHANVWIVPRGDLR